jgi:hypothetical protein
MDAPQRQPENALSAPSCRIKCSSLHECVCTLRGAFAITSSVFAARPDALLEPPRRIGSPCL